MRMMGKRQIGQMQPYEIVITLLVADVVAAPMQEDVYKRQQVGDEVEVRVHPTMIPLDHPLNSVSGPFNAVYADTCLLYTSSFCSL